MIRSLLSKLPLAKFSSYIEEHPEFSVRLNKIAAVFWAINFPIVIFLYFLFPEVWMAISILYLALVSIYANFVGHISAVEAAQGNAKQDEIEHARQEEGVKRDKELVEKIDAITPDPED